MSIFLILLCGMAAPQSVPPGWKIVKDDKGQCQMAVPPDWTVSKGMAFHKNTPPDQAEVAFDTETVVPMVERMQKMWHVDQMFENTSNRVFYSVGGGRSKDFRVRVPRAGGACNATVTFGPPTTEETVKKIILTLGPAK
jgi:hypothetical protein